MDNGHDYRDDIKSLEKLILEYGKDLGEPVEKTKEKIKMATAWPSTKSKSKIILQEELGVSEWALFEKQF